ncbi:MAG: 50S ribosomal protein L4 [Deltaproteobacteria bacterium]|nr:50S ribosomal protein L4 [Deltaproteobacteria bacterium]
MGFPVYNMQKKKVKEVELSAAVFEKPLRSVLHQAILGYQANKKQGTSSTLTRHFVTGSTRKIYRQKGTGQARHGDIKAPIFVGGGSVFGPHPRDRSHKLTTSMKHEALREALSLKKKQDQFLLIDQFQFEKTKTKEAVKVLQTLGLDNVLIVMDQANTETLKSVRNIPHVKICRSTDLNALEVMKHEIILMTVDSLGKVEKWLTA